MTRKFEVEFSGNPDFQWMLSYLKRVHEPAGYLPDYRWQLPF
jgi:hypothetical protein